MDNNTNTYEIISRTLYICLHKLFLIVYKQENVIVQTINIVPTTALDDKLVHCVARACSVLCVLLCGFYFPLHSGALCNVLLVALSVSAGHCTTAPGILEYRVS